MGYHLTGVAYNPCTCKVGCPCVLGELEADRGYCYAIVGLDIKTGAVDNVNVGGTKAAMVVDFPKGFLQGNGTARLYFDSAVTKPQQDALLPVLGGKRGGIWEVFASLIPNILGVETAPIKIEGDAKGGKFSVGNIAGFEFQVLKGASGEPTRVLHGAATFRDNVFFGKCTSWAKATGLHDWKNEGGHIDTSEFDMSGN